jgi:hypothetical protein
MECRTKNWSGFLGLRSAPPDRLFAKKIVCSKYLPLSAHNPSPL